jgi:pseudaminic acid synthase
METIKAAKEVGADGIKVQTYSADTMTMNWDNEFFRIKQGTIWDDTNFYHLYQQVYTP